MKDDAIATKLVQDWAVTRIDAPTEDNYDYDAVKEEVVTHLEDFISNAVSATDSDCEDLANNGKQEVVDEITDSLGELLDRILGSDREGIEQVLNDADVRLRLIDVERRLGDAVVLQIQTQLEGNIEVRTINWRSVSLMLTVDSTFVMPTPGPGDSSGLARALGQLLATAEYVAERVKSKRLPQRLDAAFARLREAVLASPYAEEDVKGVESYVETTVAEIEASAARLRERRVELHRPAAGDQGLPTLDPVGDAVANAALIAEGRAALDAAIYGKEG